jgi:fumarate reductase subunit D
MVLALETAAGVLLGLLVYRGLTSFSKEAGVSIPAMLAIVIGAILVLGIVIVIVWGGIYVLHHQRELLAILRNNLGTIALAIVAIFLLGFIPALASDIKAGRGAKAIAIKSFCSECGSKGLRFKRFKGSLQAEDSKKHDHPTGACLQCGHEQELFS